MKRENISMVLKALYVAVALLLLLGTAIGLYGGFLERQAVIETQLAHIRQELASISLQLTDFTDRITQLETSDAQREIKIRNLERAVEHVCTCD